MLTNEQKAVLAEFDGWNVKGTTAVKNGYLSSLMFVDEMPYDTDWNWAMPLYRKVMTMPFTWSSFNPATGNNIIRLKLLLVDITLFQEEKPERLSIELHKFIVFYNEHKSVIEVPEEKQEKYLHQMNEKLNDIANGNE